MKSVLKAPGTKLLRLKCDELLSSFAFNFNMRRYNVRDIARALAVYGAAFAVGAAGMCSPRHQTFL